MDKPEVPPLPTWMILILALCLIGLAGHIVVESLGGDGFVTSSTESAGHGDEQFVLVSAALLLVHCIWMKIGPQPVPFQHFASQPPLLPPPNY